MPEMSESSITERAEALIIHESFLSSKKSIATFEKVGGIGFYELGKMFS